MCKRPLVRVLWPNKLSIEKALFMCRSAHGYDWWTMTKRTRSQIQVDEMGFLRRVAGISPRDKVRFTRERSQLKWFEHLVRMPPGATSSWWEASPRTRWGEIMSLHWLGNAWGSTKRRRRYWPRKRYLGFLTGESMTLCSLTYPQEKLLLHCTG